MKKLISLLLALLLGLTTLVAFADETPVFDLDTATFRGTFDMLMTNSGLTPEWSTSADGLVHTCVVENYPDVTIITNSQGLISSVSIAAEMNLLNVSTMGNNFGEMMSYTSMTTLMLTDTAFMNDVNSFMTLLVNLLNEGLGALDDDTTQSTQTATAYGAEFTLNASTPEANAMKFLVSFSVKPAAQEPAAQDALSSLDLSGLLDFSAAQAPAEAFPYELDTYKQYFDMFSSSIVGATPVWETAADGMSLLATIEGLGTAVVELNGEGKAVRIHTEFTTSATSDTVAQDSNAFGQLVALSALSSKAAEDLTFIADPANTNQFTTDILAMLNDLMGKINEAIGQEVAVSAEVSGDTCTFTMILDIATMTLKMGFVYEP